jgi:hypothetical protein
VGRGHATRRFAQRQKRRAVRRLGLETCHFFFRVNSSSESRLASGRDFRYGPIAARVTASTERVITSIGSFILFSTLTGVILAAASIVRGPVVVSVVPSIVPVQRHLLCFDPRCSSAPLRRRARDQVGCHVNRWMRPRICPNSRCVKWLSASWSTKYRACRTRRPPVLNSRCWRLVSDQP